MLLLAVGAAAGWPMPAMAFDPAAKISASTGKTPRITDADLKAMARKLQRARRPGGLAKIGQPATAPLASALQARRIQAGPNAPMALSGSVLPGGARIHMNALLGTPAFIDGPGLRNADGIPKLSGANAAPGVRALAYFQAHRDLFKLSDPGAELRFAAQTVDRMGNRHETFRQEFQGVPVWAGEINAHFDPAGQLYAVNAHYAPTPLMPPGWRYKITGAQAVAAAGADLQRKTPIESLSPEARRILEYAGPAVEKNVWMEPSGRSAHWAWRVEIRPNFRDQWRYFVDGVTGAILEKYNATNADGPKTATATDLLGTARTLNTYQVGANFYLIDGTRKPFDAKSALPNDPKGALWTLDAGNTDLTKVSQVSSANNTWTDAAAVSAHFNLGKVYEYYLNTFQRVGIDGAGGTMISAVHVTEKGKKMDNAYWNGKAMAYGDGDQGFLSLPRALDVAAHEMTHGIISATVNLEYKFQSGALNESLADVFGTMVDRDDWKLGEDVVKTAVFKSGALRDMQDPHNGAKGPSENGWQPAHMNEIINATLDDDNGGVHGNSGIPNRACFLIANVIGREKTEKIYYRVMEAKYLNPGSQFIDMRLACIRSATDLFGETSPEVTAVKEGFAGVGIGTGAATDTPTPRPRDVPPVSGQEFIAVVNAAVGDNSLYIARPVVVADTDIVQLTKTQVFTGTGNPIAIPDDGSAVIFIDADHALHGIDDQGEQVVSADGVWKSIAVSPDGSKVAATTLEADAKIYILDLVNADNSKSIPLYTPTTGLAIKANNVVYADALDFNSTGEFLLYDALNRVTQAEGDPIEYYDANLLDIKQGLITPFLPTRPDGISIGNPSFAQTSDLNLVFDLFDESTSEWTVVSADLFNGTYQVIDSNGTGPGFPRYSTLDDKVIYERAEGKAINIQQAPLAKDKITLAGPAVSYLTDAQKPLWFAIGKRPAGIRLPGSRVPDSFRLAAEAGGSVLKLELPVAAEIVVTAYALSGRKLGEIIRGHQSAGTLRLKWDGPARGGMYLVRMEAHPLTGPARTLALRVARAD